jgi:hypothetical protein
MAFNLMLLVMICCCHKLGEPALVADRLTEMASVRDVVCELLTLTKQRTAARSSRPAPIFAVGDFAFPSSKDLHIHPQKCKHLRD